MHMPQLDEGGLAEFRDQIQGARCYLEYGAGGTTEYALSLETVSVIVSIDSDRAWLDKIRASQRMRAGCHLIHADIGPVGEWGQPTDQSGVTRYWSYVVKPWSVAANLRVVPDLVLIDGRFRVASFLYSLLCCRTGTPILFDDYLDRPEYFIVEHFCAMTSKHGRAGLFHASRLPLSGEIVASILEYSTRTS